MKLYVSVIYVYYPEFEWKSLEKAPFFILGDLIKQINHANLA